MNASQTYQTISEMYLYQTIAGMINYQPEGAYALSQDILPHLTISSVLLNNQSKIITYYHKIYYQT